MNSYKMSPEKYRSIAAKKETTIASTSIKTEATTSTARVINEMSTKTLNCDDGVARHSKFFQNSNQVGVMYHIFIII